jgi:hypothetical protein
MTTSSDSTLPKNQSAPEYGEYDKALRPSLTELDKHVKTLFITAFESQLQVIDKIHLNLITETEKLWGPDAGVGIPKMSKLLKTLNDYVEEGIPRQHAALGSYISTVAKGLDDIRSKQPVKVKRALTTSDIEVHEGDNKEEQEAKSGKKTLKSIGFSPSVAVPLKGLVAFHFSKGGRQRLLAIEHKITIVVKDFLNAWWVLVFKNLKDGDKAAERLTQLQKLVNEQHEYLKAYSIHSAAYLVQKIAEDAHKISVPQIRAAQKGKVQELDALRQQLIHEKTEWGAHMKLWTANVVLSLQLSRLKSNINTELEALKEQSENQIFEPLKRELDKAEKLLEHIENLSSQGRIEEASKLTLTLHTKVMLDELELSESVQLIKHFTRKLPSSLTTFTEEDVQVTIDASYLADYFVEMHLVSQLQALLMELPTRASSSISALANNMKLIGFTLSADTEETDGSMAIEEVLGKCRESAEEARTSLEEVRGNFFREFKEIKDKAYEKLLVNALLHEAPEGGSNGRAGGELTSNTRFFDGWLNRTGLVIHKYSRIINTQKDELLYAEYKAKNAQDESCHAVMRNFYESVSPSREVRAALPVYYRQLFVGKHAPRESLFIHREREMEQARNAVRRISQGAGGAIVAIGESLSGKSFFVEMVCRQIQTDNVYRIEPPPTGTTNPDNLLRVVAHHLGAEPNGIATFGLAPKGSVFLFDDLELWWARHKDGWKTMDLFCEVVERYSKDYIFIASMNSQAYRLIKNKRRFANAFIETISMSPFTLKKLEEALVERHKTGGLKVMLDGVAEENILPKNQRTFLETILDNSDGNIGVALHLWLGHVKQFDGHTISMKSARPKEMPVLTDKLWLIALTQIAMHKSTGLRKLSQVLNQSQSETLSLMNNMKRAALIEEVSAGGFQLSSYLQPFIMKQLKKFQLI